MNQIDSTQPTDIAKVDPNYPLDQMLDAITTLEECGNCEFLGVKQDCWGKWLVNVRFKTSNDYVAFNRTTLILYAASARAGQLK